LQGVKFRSGDYWDTTQDVNCGDFIYLDPPYFNTRGRYYGTIDYEKFLEYLEWLNQRGVKYALSFDGKRGDTDYSVEIPTELFKRHLMLLSGNSSFKKVMDKKSETVYESLYLNY
jgi:DNA adenine methylase